MNSRDSHESCHAWAIIKHFFHMGTAPADHTNVFGLFKQVQDFATWILFWSRSSFVL